MTAQSLMNTQVWLPAGGSTAMQLPANAAQTLSLANGMTSASLLGLALGSGALGTGLAPPPLQHPAAVIRVAPSGHATQQQDSSQGSASSSDAAQKSHQQNHPTGPQLGHQHAESSPTKHEDNGVSASKRAFATDEREQCKRLCRPGQVSQQVRGRHCGVLSVPYSALLRSGGSRVRSTGLTAFLTS